MPRDGSGVYTLPSGNPVVTNTVIASTWANSTMSDIAAQLNNVFTRDGTLGPTGPFKLMDGTVAAPGLAFNSEPGLGWYREAAGVVSMAAGGAQTIAFNAASTTASYVVIGPRATGTGTFQMWHEPQTNRANTDLFSLSKGAAGTTFLTQPVGTGTAKPFFFRGAPRYEFDNNTIITSASSAAFFLNKGIVAAENSINAQFGALNQYRLIMGDGTAGSDLHWQRFDDAGAYLGTFMHVSRLGGTVSFNDPGGVQIAAMLSANGGITSPNLLLTGGYPRLVQDAGFVYFQMTADWFWRYNKSNGDLAWIRPGALPPATFQAGGDFFAGGNLFRGNDVNFGLIVGATERYIRFAESDNWRLQWAIANGSLMYVSNSGGVLFSCDASGNFNAKAQLASGPAGVNSGGPVLSSANQGPSLFWDGGGYNIVRLQNGGSASAAWSIGWERAGGTFHFFGGSTNDLFTITGAGTARATADITCGGNMNANAGNYYMLANNTARINHLGYDTSNYTNSGGTLFNNLLNSNPQFAFTLATQHTPGTNAQWQFQLGGVAFSFLNSSVAHKTSGDPTWAVGSDVRLKQNIVDSSVGLAEIMSLRVREYEFIPHPELYDVGAETREAYPDFDYSPQGTYIGIVADEAEVGFPHIIKRGPGKVGADDVPDLATLHAGPVIWALVNAIKTLNERITQLENP